MTLLDKLVPILLGALIICYSTLHLYIGYAERLKTITQREKRKSDQDNGLKIMPVASDFDWKTEDPCNMYPFKDKAYKLTMSVRNMVAQDWLLIENTYLRRIEEKTKLVTNTHPLYSKEKDTEKCTVFATEDAGPAIREFYEIAVKFMYDKYPMYFSIKEGNMIHNLITGEDIPMYSRTLPLRELINNLVRTIEEDFIIMMPDPARKDEPNGTEYFFKGGVFAFANGFNPADKVNKPLTAIHEPVPGYKEKLQFSMNKFFGRLKVGEFVGRANFSVQTHSKLYDDDTNKGYHFQPQSFNVLDFEKIDFTKDMNYRSERQVLTRLPKTKAVVFTIRTYLHPFSDFDTLEAAKRFLGAIKGLPEDLRKYKNEPFWGKAATKFLDEL